MWDEIDSVNPLPVCSCAGCTCNLTKKFYNLQQQQRLLNFLMKVDKKYAQVRTNILMMPELPNISQAYRLLVQEQRHQELNLLSNEENGGVAFVVDKRSHSDKTGKFGPKPWHPGGSSAPGNKGVIGVKRIASYFCTHCKVHGHSIERCWKVHGYPPGFKPNTWRRNSGGPGGHANLAQDGKLEQNSFKTTLEDKLNNTSLTTSQYQKLLQIMEQDDPESDHLAHQPSSDSTALVAGTFCLFSQTHVGWIVDSGASDHMCNDLTRFASYHALPTNKHYITIPNGKKVEVKLTGTIKLTIGLLL